MQKGLYMCFNTYHLQAYCTKLLTRLKFAFSVEFVPQPTRNPFKKPSDRQTNVHKIADFEPSKTGTRLVSCYLKGRVDTILSVLCCKDCRLSFCKHNTLQSGCHAMFVS